MLSFYRGWIPTGRLKQRAFLWKWSLVHWLVYGREGSTRIWWSALMTQPCVPAACMVYPADRCVCMCVSVSSMWVCRCPHTHGEKGESIRCHALSHSSALPRSICLHPPIPSSSMDAECLNSDPQDYVALSRLLSPILETGFEHSVVLLWSRPYVFS